MLCRRLWKSKRSQRVTSSLPLPIRTRIKRAYVKQKGSSGHLLPQMCFNTNNSTDSLFFFFCLTTIADQCHNWYEMMQQAETDSEWLPLKKQATEEKWQRTANECILGRNGTERIIQSAATSSSQPRRTELRGRRRRRREGWGVWCLSPWAGLGWQAPR